MKYAALLLIPILFTHAASGADEDEWKKLGISDSGKYPTVPKFVEEGSTGFSESNGTFKVLKERPLHIRISPQVSKSDSPEVITNLTEMALVQTVYDSFAHTPVDKFTITAVPLSDDDNSLLQKYAITVTTTRKQALGILNHYFPGKGFEDLEDHHQPTDISNRISYEDREPGVKAVLANLLSGKVPTGPSPSIAYQKPIAPKSEDEQHLASELIKRMMENIFHDDLVTASCGSAADNGYEVMVTFNANGLSKSDTRRLIEHRMRDAYKALYTSHLDVVGAAMFAYSKLTDKYGGEGNAPLYKTLLDSEEA